MEKKNQERQDLAERVMVTRLHLYGQWIKVINYTCYLFNYSVFLTLIMLLKVLSTLHSLFQKCDHAKMYQKISEENLQLMRERLMETVIWPTDDTTTDKIG